jgi:uncharacterized membrane protein YkvA (DUF1232 family)
MTYVERIPLRAAHPASARRLRDDAAVSWLQPLLAFAATVVGLWLLAVAFIWLHRPSRNLAREALALLPELLRLARRLVADPATPVAVRVALAGLALWIASPIDLLPEFLPGIGALDDIVVAAVVLRWAGRRLGPERLRRHWTGSPEGFGILMRLIGFD